MQEGIIEVNSEYGKELGLTSEYFGGDTYLWGMPFYNGIIVSNISSHKKGGFKKLMENIEKKGFVFRIPTPSKRMQEIGKKQGWIFTGDTNGLTFLTNKVENENT